MKYSISIRNNKTGEIRRYAFDFDWHGSSEFWLTDGNYGCDCNREMAFMKAGSEICDEDFHYKCGDSRFTIVDATLEDGSVIKIDDEVSGE